LFQEEKLKEMARLEQERLETQAREQALAASVASKKKQLLTDLVNLLISKTGEREI
jgi:hypothetical protein